MGAASMKAGFKLSQYPTDRSAVAFKDRAGILTSLQSLSLMPHQSIQYLRQVFGGNLDGSVGLEELIGERLEV